MGQPWTTCCPCSRDGMELLHPASYCLNVIGIKSPLPESPLEGLVLIGDVAPPSPFPEKGGGLMSAGTHFM